MAASAGTAAGIAVGGGIVALAHGAIIAAKKIRSRDETGGTRVIVNLGSFAEFEIVGASGAARS